MSRSYRRTPIVGNHRSRGEKWYKRIRAHQERTRLRSALASGSYDGLEIELAPWDEWETGRDGKQYDPDYFNGKVSPRYWSGPPAWKALKKEFDPALAKKRRSK